MRRLLVSSCLADVTQQIHSLRASGVISAHRSLTFGSDSIALQKSVGIVCTVPSETLCAIEPLYKTMAEKIALRVFWTFMLLCAGVALTDIWFEHVLPEKLIPTFFIIGFASFLIWAPLVVYKFLAKIK